MDKTQALKELLDCYEVSDDMSIPDLCERVWDAAAASVTPQSQVALKTLVESYQLGCANRGGEESL
jgi:hypothetical protein